VGPRPPAGDTQPNGCWELDPSRLDEARRALEVISQQWDRTRERLKEFVERA
jgi:hypothetical protein